MLEIPQQPQYHIQSDKDKPIVVIEKGKPIGHIKELTWQVSVEEKKQPRVKFVRVVDGKDEIFEGFATLDIAGDSGILSTDTTHPHYNTLVYEKQGLMVGTMPRVEFVKAEFSAEMPDRWDLTIKRSIEYKQS